MEFKPESKPRDEGLTPEVRASLAKFSFQQIREAIGIWLHSAGGGARLWDLMCGLRGPDSPSERPDLSGEENARLYRGRRDRKYKTVEVIREAAFFGSTGGSARSHHGTYVTLPPSQKWDHFDKHVQRAASVLGLKVETDE